MGSIFKLGHWDRYLLVICLLMVLGSLSGISSTAILVFLNGLFVTAAFVGQRKFSELVRLVPLLIAAAGTLVWALWNVAHSSVINVSARESVNVFAFLIPTGIMFLVAAESWLLRTWIMNRSGKTDASTSSNRTRWMVGVAALLFTIAIIGQLIRGQVVNTRGQLTFVVAVLILSFGFTFIAFLIRHINSRYLSFCAVAALYAAFLMLSFATAPYFGSFVGLVPLIVTITCCLICTCFTGKLFKHEATESVTTSEPTKYRLSIYSLAALGFATALGCFAWFHDLSTFSIEPSLQSARVVRKVMAVDGMQAEVQSLQPLTTIGLKRGLEIDASISNPQNCNLFEVLGEVSDSHNYVELVLEGLAPNMNCSPIGKFSKRVLIKNSRLSTEQIPHLTDATHSLFLHDCEIVRLEKAQNWNLESDGIYLSGCTPGSVANMLEQMNLVKKKYFSISDPSLNENDWEAICKASTKGGTFGIEINVVPKPEEIDRICATESDPNAIEVQLNSVTDSGLESLPTTSLKKLLFNSGVTLKLPWHESDVLQSSVSDQDFWDAFLASEIIGIRDFLSSKLQTSTPQQLRDFHLCFDGLGHDAPVEKLMLPDTSPDLISIASTHTDLKSLILGEVRKHRRAYSKHKSELSQLASLTKLESLFFGAWTPVQDCSFMAKMPKLKYLTMPGTCWGAAAPANFPASKLTALEEVTLTNMVQPGFERKIAALPNLKKVKVLLLNHIEFSKQDIAKMKACFPANIQFEFSRDHHQPPDDFLRHEEQRKSLVRKKHEIK